MGGGRDWVTAFGCHRASRNPLILAQHSAPTENQTTRNEGTV